VGARPASLGGAFIAVPGDVHSVYYNPAALITLEGVPPGAYGPHSGAEGTAERRPVSVPSATQFLRNKQFAVSYLNHFLDFQSGFFVFGASLGKWGAAGVAFHYMNYGDFKRTDDLGNELGTFSAADLLFELSYAYLLAPNFSVGIGLKWVQGSIAEYRTTAVAADVGFFYSIPSQDLSFGFGVFNSGRVLDPYIQTKDRLPVNYRVGFSKRLAHLPLLLSMEGYRYEGEDPEFILGGEFTLTPYWLLRISYNSIGREQKLNQVGDKYAGISIGTGLRLDKTHFLRRGFWKVLYFDYAYTSAGHVGTLNRLSFRFEL